MYLTIKLVHILSATILFGTGLGTAFFMITSYLSNDDSAMPTTARTVVLADWMFTAPAVVIQLVSGLWLTHQLGISFSSTWFVMVLALFVLVGACWTPVVWIQIRISDLIRKGARKEDYRHLMRAWVGLGVPAFLCVAAIFYLMVFKVGAYS